MLRIGSTFRASRRFLNRQLHFQCPIIAGDSAIAGIVPVSYRRFIPFNYSSSFGIIPASASLFSTLSSNSSIFNAPNTERAEENDNVESNLSVAGDAGVALLEVERVAPRLSDGILDAYLAIELALDSVVKIFTVSSSPNYFLPWQNKSQRETTGSGFVIRGKRILTNAHVVADHTFVLVRKHGSPTKYRATVQAVGHECDLAILVVESEEFWEGMNSLELGEVPFLQEAVSVVGYPQGGDNISVTKGVVSRVEPTQYVHGASQLLAIQIDAAINPGNSGGPAIMGDKVAGVAFQNLSGAENIGYIIPVPVIKHFISGVEERGDYFGFCSLGLSCQPTENAQIREYFQMQSKMTGVLVSRINPLSDASRVLKKDDIVLSFDGVPIASDGTVPFRNRERISFDHLVSMKKPNETAELEVLRDGEVHDFKITLHPLQPLVPVHQFDKLPSYFIFAGLVFIPLTQPFLHEYGEEWYNTSPRRLCERALRELPKKPGEQFVILSQVLMDDINAGYERLAELQVKKVNGVEVLNLKHLRQLVEDGNQKNVRFDLDDERVIVLNYESVKTLSSSPSSPMASSSSSLHFLSLTPQTLPKPTSQTTSISFFSLPSSSLNLSLSSSSTPRYFESSRFVRKVTLSDFDQIEEVGAGDDDEEEEGGLSDEGASYQERNANPDLKIFVGNLPFSVDSAYLAELFERAGDVEMVEVIYDKLTGRSRGFGFVTMSSKEAVEAACQQFNGYEIDGRALRVNSGPAPPKRENSFGGNSSYQGGRGGGSMDSSNRVYVGNLAWSVDQQQLETLFSEQGKVVDAKVVYDRDSGRSRGFGFVTYSSAQEVNDAIESLDGVDLGGRAIRVSPAEARPPRRQF